jgi:hypothetical protein
MASVNLGGSKSLAEALNRAKGTFVKESDVTKWWNAYGASQAESASSLMTDFEKREQAAIKANRAREKEIRDMYSQILNQDYGAARAAGESVIARGERTSIGQGMQQLVSSGLFGTTTAAALPSAAKRISTEQRLTLEDVLQQRTEATKKELASFIERIEQPYPDYGMLLQAIAAQSS